jgi:hypothetical protein
MEKVMHPGNEARERCGECRFWDMDPRDDRTNVGECHRMPPQMVADSKFIASIGDDSINPMTGFFPETLANQWCGEWRPASKGNLR